MSTEVNEFVFDSLLPQEFPVKFGEDKYVLCEIDGETDVWYKETILKIAKPDMTTQIGYAHQRATSRQHRRLRDIGRVAKHCHRACFSSTRSVHQPVLADSLQRHEHVAISYLATVHK